MLLALYQQIIFRQTIANLRSASAAPLMAEVCISGAFSFSFRLSALRITHNPSELNGKRMAERLPVHIPAVFYVSAHRHTSGQALYHLPTVVPYRFWSQIPESNWHILL